MRLIHFLLAWISITTSKAYVAITVTSQFHDAGNTGDWFTYGNCVFTLSRSYSTGEMTVKIVTNYPVSSSTLTATNMTVNSASGNKFNLTNQNIENPGTFTLSFELRYPSSGSLAGYCASNVEYVETTTPETTEASSTTVTTEATSTTVTAKLSSTTVTSQVPSTSVTTQAPSTTVTTQAPYSTSSASTETSPYTQTIVPVSLSAAGCMCACKEMGSAANTNYTQKELAKRIDKIVAALKVDKKETSVAQRKRKSATDDRPSARAVGTIGIVLLSVTLGILILFDLDNFIRFIMEFKKCKS